jgi:Tfp pilus assembly protein PilN
MAVAWVTGVCVGRNRLEWTVLRRAKESWEVHAQGSSERPGEGADAGAWLKLAAKNFRGRLSVALPTERVLLRVALLPSTEGEELRGMAELQTDRYSPFPVDSLSLGAEVVEASDHSSLVAMAAVRRNEIDEVGRGFQEAGAPPDGVDVEALGGWWGLKHSGQVPGHGSQIFVRVERDGAEMVVARDGEPLLFRSLPSPPEDWGAGGAEWIAECAEEMGYSLTSLETEWGASSAPSLHVYHEPGVPPDWAEGLREALGLEILFKHLLVELPTVSEGVARRLAEPAGPLAMDLAPAEWREADADRSLRRRLLRTATVFLAAWLLGIGAFWTALNVQRGQMDRLQAEVDAIEAPALQVRRLRAKVLEFSQYADRTHSALECLRVVSEGLPMGMDLSSFIYRKGGNLVLRGEADAPDKVYAFNEAMERLALFAEVKLEGVTTRTTPQGQRSQFGATLRLPGAGEAP